MRHKKNNRQLEYWHLLKASAMPNTHNVEWVVENSNRE